MLVEVKEVPVEGQFTVVWIYNNRPWAETYVVDGDEFLLTSASELGELKYKAENLFWHPSFPFYEDYNPEVKIFVKEEAAPATTH